MSYRHVALGAAGLCAAAALFAAMPESRRIVRHVIAHHRPVHFGIVTAERVVPVEKTLSPAPPADPRFAPAPLAEVALATLPPRLDADAFVPPIVTTPRAVAKAEPLDETTTAAAPVSKTDQATIASDLAGARQALRHYHEGDLAGGDDFGRLTDGPLRTALDWAAIRLASKQAGADRLQAFSDGHPGWPMRRWIDRRIEEARVGLLDAPHILALFKASAPETLAGKLALARARNAGGDTGGAADIVRKLWRDDDLSAGEEAGIVRDFGALLRTEDHKARADRLLYKESVPDALRVAQWAGADVVLLAKARAAVIANAPADAAIAAVPKALQADPGLIFARIQKARRANRMAEAADLLKGAPREPALLIDGDAWWVERRLIARKLLDLGNAQAAYDIVAAAAPDNNALQVEAAFHAGWIALRFLDKPALAAPHFASAAALAETPISIARAAYWQGRAAEALGDASGAARFYAVAAGQPTTFYGQLASARNGQAVIALRPQPVATEGAARRDSIQAVDLLFALGERDLAASLALATAKSEPDESQVAALAAVMESTQDARATLIVGKAATQRGMPVDEAAFPTFGIPGYRPLDRSADRSTVFAIARQESEFDPHSVSSAGAKGLMQVIDSTARQTAQAAGVAFDGGRMLSDAAFNAQIGAAHLGKLLADLDGSYILTFAAYNAGSHKVQEWMATYGDPRKPGVDPIDWIERIPFTETRNYVQRVFENMQIYRVRFGVPIAQLSEPQPVAGGGKGT